MTTCRILLADDTADVRLLLRLILEGTGSFTVVAEATNGHEAVSMAAAHLPDIVLLDLAMPVMDGSQALPEILSRSPASKVVILSGFSAGRVAQEALELGAHTYIEKGSAAPDMVRTLEAIARPAA